MTHTPIRESGQPRVAGIALGALAAISIAGKLGGLLFETEARDPVVFLSGALLLGCVCLLAAALPAWRAAHVDPAVSMKVE